MHSHLVVAGKQVEGGEVLGAAEVVQEVIDTGERIAVFDGDLVEGAVVNAEAQSAIRFLGKDDVGGEGGL